MLRGIDEWNGQVFRVSRDRRRSLAWAGLRIVNRPAAHSHLASAHLRTSATRPGPRYNVGHTSAMSPESKILAPLYVHRQREESSGRRGNVAFLALGICTITMHDRKERSQYDACSVCLLRMNVGPTNTLIWLANRRHHNSPDQRYLR